MPKNNRSTRTRSSGGTIPSNPVTFLVALIRAMVAINQANGYPDNHWCHQLYPPAGGNVGLRDEFFKALRAGLLTVPRDIQTAAVKLAEQYPPEVATFIATVRSAVEKGLVQDRNFGGKQWKLAVTADLPERSQQRKQKQTAAEVKAELAALLG